MKTHSNITHFIVCVKFKNKLTMLLIINGLIVCSLTWIMWLFGFKYITTMLIAKAIWIFEAFSLSCFFGHNLLIIFVIADSSPFIFLNNFLKHLSTFGLPFHFLMSLADDCEFTIGGKSLPNIWLMASLTFEVKVPRTLRCWAVNYLKKINLKF